MVKARLAYNWFAVVYDEISVVEENTYFEKKGLKAPYKFVEG